MSSAAGEQAKSLAFLMSNPAISTYISTTPAVSKLFNDVPGAAAAAAGFVAMNPYLFVPPVMSGGNPSGITSGPSGTYFITSTGPAIENIRVTGPVSSIIPVDVPSPIFNVTGAVTESVSSTEYVEPVLTPIAKSSYTFVTISETKKYLDSKVAILNTPGLLQSGGYSVATKAIFDVLSACHPDIVLKEGLEVVNFYIMFTKLNIQIDNCKALKLEENYLKDRFLSNSRWFVYGNFTEEENVTYFRACLLSEKDEGFISLSLKAIRNFCNPKLEFVKIPNISRTTLLRNLSEPSPTLGQDIDIYLNTYTRKLNDIINEFIIQGEFLSANSFINHILQMITEVINKFKRHLSIANNDMLGSDSIYKKNIAIAYRPSVLNSIILYLSKLTNFYTEVKIINDKIISETTSRSNPATVVQSMQGSFSDLSDSASPKYSIAVNNIYDKTLTEAYNLLSIGSAAKAVTLIRDVINKINSSNRATGAQSGGGPSITDIIDNLNNLNNSIGSNNPSGPSGSSNTLLGGIIPPIEPLDISRLELNNLPGPSGSSGPSGPSGSIVVIPGIILPSGPTVVKVATGATGAVQTPTGPAPGTVSMYTGEEEDDFLRGEENLVLTPIGRYAYTFTTVEDASTFLDSKVAILNTPDLFKSGKYSEATKEIIGVFKSLRAPLLALLPTDYVETVKLYSLLTKIKIKMINSQAYKDEHKFLWNKYLKTTVYDLTSGGETYYRVVVASSYGGFLYSVNALLGIIGKQWNKPYITRVAIPLIPKMLLSREQLLQNSPEPDVNISAKLDNDIEKIITPLTPMINEFINQNEFLSGISFLSPIGSTISSIINSAKFSLRDANDSAKPQQTFVKEIIPILFRPSVVNALNIYINKLSNLSIQLTSLKEKLTSSMVIKSNPTTVVQSMQSNFSTLNNATNVASPEYNKAVDKIYNTTVSNVYNLLITGSYDKAQTLLQDVINKMNTNNGPTGATGAQRGGNPSGSESTNLLNSVINNLLELKNTIGANNPSGPSGSSNNILNEIIEKETPVDTGAVILDAIYALSEPSGPSVPSGPSGAITVIPGFTLSGVSSFSGAQTTGASPSTGVTGATDLSGVRDLSGASGPSAASGDTMQPLFLSANSFFSPIFNMIKFAMAEQPPPPPPPPPPTDETGETEETDEGNEGNAGNEDNPSNESNAPVNNSSGGGKIKERKKRKTRRRLKVRK